MQQGGSGELLSLKKCEISPFGEIRTPLSSSSGRRSPMGRDTVPVPFLLGQFACEAGKKAQGHIMKSTSVNAWVR